MSDRTKNRQKVAGLISDVLTQKIIVRQALERFPTDTSDLSLHCAWYALVHFEADEDIRAEDIEYREEQDDYLEFISSLLYEGKDLPRDILANYKEYYEGSSMNYEKGFKGLLKSLLRFINL